MVKISEDLIRKKAEHNEKIIGTLEELSLHQEDIEKIEHINNWCKNLQILLLQANLIPKIENLNKLKALQYLNLALNNIEIIENLERCESLEKLDLTLNFIGNLESVETLKSNIHLRHLYLTGNPCCEFPDYRDYVIAVLPQLETLDGTEIHRSSRIKAQQNLSKMEKRLEKAQRKYVSFREEQRKRMDNEHNNFKNLNDDEFWKACSEHCPETRIEIAKRSRKAKRLDEEDEPKKTKKMVTLFNKDGKPLNVNQAKLQFEFHDDNPEKFVLDLAIYKYLDTSLIDVDLQPIYVRITVKDKVFQIVFPEEIFTDKSTAKRSQITGHLLLELPRVNYKPTLTGKKLKKNLIIQKQDENESLELQTIVAKFNELHANTDVPPLEYG